MIGSRKCMISMMWKWMVGMMNPPLLSIQSARNDLQYPMMVRDYRCITVVLIVCLFNQQIMKFCEHFLLYSDYNPAIEVIRLHRSISRKGKTWRRGDHLKIHKGATGRMKTAFYSLKTSLCTTLEYIVVEGLQGDICGEFTHVLMYSSFMTYPHSERGWISFISDVGLPYSQVKPALYAGPFLIPIYP